MRDVHMRCHVYRTFARLGLLLLATALWSEDVGSLLELPNGRLLGETPGQPRSMNNLPTAAALSPDGRFAAFLHSGYGSYLSNKFQSISVLNLETNELTDFPDARLGPRARQTFFLGLAFSRDGRHLFASLASLSDPLAKQPDSTGNAIAVYGFASGKISPERLLPLAPRSQLPHGKLRRTKFASVTYPAGLSVAASSGQERILVASNLSDEAILLEAATGKILERFDLSTFSRIPASLPYTTVMSADGRRGFVSLWNASAVAELDLVRGHIVRLIPLGKLEAPNSGGSHPSALVLDRAGKRLFVALTNRDQIAMVDTATGKTLALLSTKLPGQSYGGSDPESLALSADEKRLFSANAISDSVAVFDLDHLAAGGLTPAQGFIPTEWYPTVVAATDKDLLIATAKGRGSGANPQSTGTKKKSGLPEYPYVLGLLRGSLARLRLADLESRLQEYTSEAVRRNQQRGNADEIGREGTKSKIRHVIYIIKENRTYDQIFGDLDVGDSDRNLTMFGAEITPNQHALARQFGVIDRFFASGDVSGDGHVWCNSASVSDYIAKTIPIDYRGNERTYDSEGSMLEGSPAEDGLPDIAEPTGGYLWKNFAAHGISYRHYGEYITSRWCLAESASGSSSGPPQRATGFCTRAVIKKGEPLEKNVGEPRGGPSPYPWDIPVLSENIASEPELRGHFDPLFPDFETSYPDQLRADEFLNEFNRYVAVRNSGRDQLPQFILLRLPDDHTAGGTPKKPTPAASVADNDLAVGRVVEAVSNSPYWDDTALLILEDDAQDGPDHVDSHRSLALVISKYSPLPERRGDQTVPFVDHTFYTTINMVRTIEVLLGVPPMNSNDARAAAMAPLVSGPGLQPAFHADDRNRRNGLIYQVNTGEWPEGAKLDFSHADAADATVLNQFLWKNRMGDAPMPQPKHHVFPPAGRD